VDHDLDVAYLAVFASLVDFEGLKVSKFVADASAFYS
jgi:hypothetical protein